MQYAKGKQKKNFALAGAYSSVINKDRDMKLGVWYRFIFAKE